MPEKLEFEEWMILVMAFNLLNTNKQKAAQSRACNQFAIRPGLWAARQQGRSAWHNSVQVGVCLCATHLIYQVRSQMSASGCSFTECPAGFFGFFLAYQQWEMSCIACNVQWATMSKPQWKEQLWCDLWADTPPKHTLPGGGWQQFWFCIEIINLQLAKLARHQKCLKITWKSIKKKTQSRTSASQPFALQPSQSAPFWRDRVVLAVTWMAVVFLALV